MVGAVALLVLGLTACGQAVAGVPRGGDGACRPVAEGASPVTPTGEPVITVDDRVSFWTANSHTAPLGLAVYADGTVISAETNGSHVDPLTPMTIGLVDGCHVQEAVDALAALAGVNFGMPGITDQAATTVTVTRSGSAPVVLSAYALGLGDDSVNATQFVAREKLTAALNTLEQAITAEQEWAPNRLQLSRFEREMAGPVRPWPLADSITDVLRQRTYGDLACGLVEGADASAIAAALGQHPALSPWQDGSETATLAVGVLVPGQPACVR